MNETTRYLRPQKELNCLLPDFTKYYEPFHTPVTMALCVLGMIGHICTVRILTKKSVLNQTNVLMIGLSCAQFIYLVSNLGLTLIIHMDKTRCVPLFWNHFWMWMVIIFNVATLFCLTAACWLMVCLSGVRCFTFRHSSRNRMNALSWFTYRRACMLCASAIILTIAICTPTVFWITVEAGHDAGRVHKCSHVIDNWSQTPGYTLAPTTWMMKHARLQSMAHWWYTVLGKMVPCAVIFVLSITLAFQLNKLKKMSKVVHLAKLRSKSYGGENEMSTMIAPPKKLTLTTTATTTGTSGFISRYSTRHIRFVRRQSRNVRINPFNRSTALIVVVMLVYEIGEIPNNVALIWYEISAQSPLECYPGAYKMLELLTMMYMSVNFAIYCSMSANFRQHFQAMLRSLTACCASSLQVFPTVLQRTLRTGGVTKSTNLSSGAAKTGENGVITNCSPLRNGDHGGFANDGDHHHFRSPPHHHEPLRCSAAAAAVTRKVTEIQVDLTNARSAPHLVGLVQEHSSDVML